MVSSVRNSVLRSVIFEGTKNVCGNYEMTKTTKQVLREGPGRSFWTEHYPASARDEIQTVESSTKFASLFNLRFIQKLRCEKEEYNGNRGENMKGNDLKDLRIKVGEGVGAGGRGGRRGGGARKLPGCLPDASKRHPNNGSRSCDRQSNESPRQWIMRCWLRTEASKSTDRTMLRPAFNYLLEKAVRTNEKLFITPRLLISSGWNVRSGATGAATAGPKTLRSS